MAVISNGSRRPIQNVACKYGYTTAVTIGRFANQQPGTPGGSSNLVDPIPLSNAEVIRAGETYGLVFDMRSNEVPIAEPPLGVARFTDDAGLHWQLDEDQHLRQLPDRDW